MPPREENATTHAMASTAGGGAFAGRAQSPTTVAPASHRRRGRGHEAQILRAPLALVDPPLPVDPRELTPMCEAEAGLGDE